MEEKTRDVPIPKYEPIPVPIPILNFNPLLSIAHKSAQIDKI